MGKGDTRCRCDLTRVRQAITPAMPTEAQVQRQDCRRQSGPPRLLKHAYDSQRDSCQHRRTTMNPAEIIAC